MNGAKPKKDNVVDIKAKYIETRKQELEECTLKINQLLEQYQCQYQLGIPLDNGQKIPLNALLVPNVTIELVSK